MALCGACERDLVDDDLRMNCRYCESVFHAKCVGINNKTVANFLMSNKNYVWYCDNCIEKNEQNTDLMKKMDDLQTIIKNHTEQIEKQAKLIENLRKTANQVVTPKSAIPSSINRKRTYAEHAEQWSDLCKTPTSVTNDIKTPKRARFHEVNSIRKRNVNPILFVKPKNDNDIESIRSEIKKAVNPMSDPVKYLRNTKSGNIVVACKSDKDISSIQQKLSNAIGDICDVDKPSARKPIIKVVGLTDFNNADEIIDCIYAQNDLSRETCTIEYMKHTQIGRQNRVYYTLYIKTDLRTFDTIMNWGKLNIMWDRVKCYEHVNDYRCFKCCKFGHKADDCEQELHTCPKCSGSHKINDCKSNEIICVNCHEINVTRKLNLDCKHFAWDSRCPVIKRRLERIKNNIRYED